MVGAYILVKTTVGKMRDVHKSLGKMDGIRDTHMVTGPYDIVVFAEADELSTIVSTLMDKVRKVDGIVDTTTCILMG